MHGLRSLEPNVDRPAAGLSHTPYELDKKPTQRAVKSAADEEKFSLWPCANGVAGHGLLACERDRHGKVASLRISTLPVDAGKGWSLRKQGTDSHAVHALQSSSSQRRRFLRLPLPGAIRRRSGWDGHGRPDDSRPFQLRAPPAQRVVLRPCRLVGSHWPWRLSPSCLRQSPGG